ncbi:SRPBCC family protein [Nocardia salmonicida]|uniref:SRPBCC family protein n=1 Tax=Nocardia salmonicida TaxID=53431 RepID=UPI00369DC643
MSTAIEAVDVDVPVATAYNQWTQFKTFPEFMQGVDRIEQLDGTHTRWTEPCTHDLIGGRDND